MGEVYPDPENQEIQEKSGSGRREKKPRGRTRPYCDQIMLTFFSRN